jgi:hypothetical protein
MLLKTFLSSPGSPNNVTAWTSGLYHCLQVAQFSTALIFWENSFDANDDCLEDHTAIQNGTVIVNSLLVGI